jgi:hypothetical protein
MQSETLSVTSFLGKLLMLPTNVRLDWKVIARYKRSSLFCRPSAMKEKSFITLTPGRRTAPTSRREFFRRILRSRCIPASASSFPAPHSAGINKFGANFFFM